MRYRVNARGITLRILLLFPSLAFFFIQYYIVADVAARVISVRDKIMRDFVVNALANA